MEQIYKYCLWKIARTYMTRATFDRLTTCDRIAWIRQHPPLLLPLYQECTKPMVYRSLQFYGIGPLTGLKKAQLIEIAAYLTIEIRK